MTFLLVPYALSLLQIYMMRVITSVIMTSF